MMGRFAIPMVVLVLLASGAEAAERKLAFAVDGVIAEVTVKAGQDVKAGTPLARLDLVPFRARKRAADEGIAAAQLTLKFSEDNVKRVKQLFDDLATSREELDKVHTELAKAKADVARARGRAEIAAWKLDRATLKAPKDGKVVSVPGYPGQVVSVQAGSPAVVVLDMQ